MTYFTSKIHVFQILLKFLKISVYMLEVHYGVRHLTIRQFKKSGFSLSNTYDWFVCGEVGGWDRGIEPIYVKSTVIDGLHIIAIFNAVDKQLVIDRWKKTL